MYTEDDKNTRYKRNNINKSDNQNINNYKDVSYEEDYYKDYYDDNDDYYSKNDNYVDNKKVKRTNKNGDVNRLDMSYDNYNDQRNYNVDSLNKKKYVVIIIILAIILFVLFIILMKSINIKTPPVGDSTIYVRLNSTELNLNVGDTQKLDVILTGNSNNYRIEWFSNNDNVVTVDNNGNIRAINEGEAIILVAYYLNNNIYDAQCRIYVSK